MSKTPLTRSIARPAACMLVLGLMLTTSNASAQVVRCVDPGNGQISYTDGACAKGPGTTIAPARSAAEVAQDDERALAARQRWQAEQLQQQQAAAHKAGTTPPTAPVSSATQRNNQACLAAQEELHALSQSNRSHTSAMDAAQRHMEMRCLGPEAYAALERSRANALAPGETTVVLPPHHVRPPAHRPPPPQEPIQRLNCNVFRCFDQNGNAMPAPRPGEVR